MYTWGMNRLKQYLVDADMTQERFAGLVGVKQSVVSRLASGAAHPSPELALRIEDATEGAVKLHDWPRFADLARREAS